MSLDSRWKERNKETISPQKGGLLYNCISLHIDSVKTINYARQSLTAGRHCSYQCTHEPSIHLINVLGARPSFIRDKPMEFWMLQVRFYQFRDLPSGAKQYGHPSPTERSWIWTRMWHRLTSASIKYVPTAWWTSFTAVGGLVREQ